MPLIPSVRFEEIAMAWEIMQGVTSGKLQTANPEQINFQDPDTGDPLKIPDHPWSRIMMAWVDHLPKESCPQIGSRVIALAMLIRALPAGLAWGVNLQTGQLHLALLHAAAYSQLYSEARAFDPATFLWDAAAERRVLELAV